jgi:hypothetical protein
MKIVISRGKVFRVNCSQFRNTGVRQLQRSQTALVLALERRRRFRHLKRDGDNTPSYIRLNRPARNRVWLRHYDSHELESTRRGRKRYNKEESVLRLTITCFCQIRGLQLNSLSVPNSLSGSSRPVVWFLSVVRRLTAASVLHHSSLVMEVSFFW